MVDEIERRILDDIDHYGWHLILIQDDPEGPAFVYSVGMMPTLNHPEIIMFGLVPKVMASVINTMGKQIRQEGRRFAELGLFEDVLEAYACKTIPVAECWHAEYLGYAMWHRRHIGQIGTLQAIQCLWPDKAGRFPDDPLCHPAIRTRQPLLSSAQTPDD